MNANQSLKSSVVSTDTLLGLGANAKRGPERSPSADDGQQNSFKAHLDRKDSQRQADSVRADDRAFAGMREAKARQDSIDESRADAAAARKAASEAKAEAADDTKTDVAADAVGDTVATDTTTEATATTDAAAGEATGTEAAGTEAGVEQGSTEEALILNPNAVAMPVVDDPLLALRPGVLAALHPVATGLVSAGTGLGEGNNLPTTAAVAASGATPAVSVGGNQAAQLAGVPLVAQTASGEVTEASSPAKATETLLKAESAPAVTTQFALNNAKAGLSAEPNMAAQGAAVALDKIAAATANLGDKSEPLLDVKSASSPRALAPALARYQLEGQPSLTQTRVQVPVGQAQWPTAIAERVLWMAAQRATSAEIHLDPPELGPLQVRVSLSQDAASASVSFTSQHAAVREALDMSSFRLREMFESQGLNLVNVDVSDQSLSRQTGEGGGQGKGGTGAGAEGEAAEAIVTKISSHNGLVDHYV